MAVARQVRAGDRGHRSRRVELDVLERHAAGQVGRLDAVDERTALEGDAAAHGVDASVRLGRPDRAGPARGSGRRRPATAASRRRDGRRPGPPPGRRAPVRSVADPHQAGIRSDSVHGSAGVSRIVTVTAPSHG